MGQSNYITLQQIEQAKANLIALKYKLEEIEKQTEDKINIFRATGMSTQEIKHSAFLAWLLDPSKPHGLKGLPLKMFCESLLDHSAPRDDFPDKSNRELIGDKLNDLDDIVSDKGITVETEKVVVNSDSRIDIFIECPRAKTLIIIENKVFTGTHDDQLNRYEDEVNIHHHTYKGYKKVFVYLTPFGSSPYDEDWCVLDYGTVLAVAERIFNGLPNKKENNRLKMLLEDYMELVDTNILKGNKELRSLCKEILREHGDAVRLLSEYTDNSAEVVAYAINYLQHNYPDIVIYRSAKQTFNFYTKKTEEFFAKNGDSLFYDDGICKCCRDIWGCDGDILTKQVLNKTRDRAWCNSQLLIMNKVAPNKKQGDKYFRFDRFSLLPESAREEPFENIKSKLDKNLELFVQKIKAFDDMLDTL